MNLGNPPDKYSQADEAKMRAEVVRSDDQNVKLNTILEKFFVRDTATGVVKTVTIASGSFVIT